MERHSHKSKPASDVCFLLLVALYSHYNIQCNWSPYCEHCDTAVAAVTNDNVNHYYTTMGLDSVVSIATFYRLDGPGIKSWWKRDLHLSSPAQPPVQWVPCLFLGGKETRAWH